MSTAKEWQKKKEKKLVSLNYSTLLTLLSFDSG
jgi:hypothetical protein